MIRLSLICLLLCFAPDLSGQLGPAYSSAQEAIQVGEFNQARFWLQEVRTDPALDFSTALGLLNALSFKQRRADALWFAESLRARFPRSAPLTYQIASYQAGIGRFEEALKNYEEALGYSETPFMTRSIEDGMAYSYWMLGRREEAVVVYRKLLVGSTGLSRANILVRLEEYQAAASEFRQLLLRSLRRGFSWSVWRYAWPS